MVAARQGIDGHEVAVHQHGLHRTRHTDIDPLRSAAALTRKLRVVMRRGCSGTPLRVASTWL